MAHHQPPLHQPSFRTSPTHVGSSKSRPMYGSRGLADRAYNAANPQNNLINSDLAHRVKRNLDLQHLWTELSIHRVPVLAPDAFEFLDGGELVFVLGRPADRLYATDEYDEDGLPVHEWILPVRTESTWSIQRTVAVFESLEAYTRAPVKRVLMGMYTDDSTVVYYFVHKGLIKPRKHG
ncbi:Sen15 protein-domain-containing protein [Myxozyma melibiosi]|uniref:Sen15 protein-domain-containing protein n=1 Tax=Myxozyma melibiosi TaxID=54550 RepID=A0ABR1FDH3_9ASCO